MTSHEIIVAGTGLVGSVVAIGGGLYAQADQQLIAVAGVLVGAAGLVTALGSVIVPTLKIMKDSKVERMSDQLTKISGQLEEHRKTAKIAVDRANQAEVKAETLLKQVEAARQENIELTSKIVDRLDQRHLETRQVLIEAKTIGTLPKVLIVDDNLDTCKRFVSWLGKNRFEGEYALSIEEAETKLHPKLSWIFIDWHLPDGCGVVLLRKIKQDRLPTKAVVITGHLTKEVERQSLDLYADMVISKPMTKDNLRDLLIFMRANEETAPRPHMSDVDMPLMPLSDSGQMLVSRIEEGP